jgi:Lrp/AsnC family transcriptional regulator for asnA, asnC and gidA
MILDGIDAAIIELLQEDGRMSAVDIAGRLEGVTPRVVRHRIKKLVRDGIISITAVVEPKALAYAVKADIMIEARLGEILDIARRLAELELVTYVALATGESDISIQVVARSAEDLYDMVQGAVHEMSGVTRTRTYLLPRQLKFTHRWRVPKEVYIQEQPDSVSEPDEGEAAPP